MKTGWVKIALLALLVYIGWMYYAGRNYLFSNPLENARNPLPTYSGYQWKGELSAYPAGYGALPYAPLQSVNGVLEWADAPFYGGH